jgi:hypothetical protein
MRDGNDEDGVPGREREAFTASSGTHVDLLEAKQTVGYRAGAQVSRILERELATCVQGGIEWAI